MSDNNILVSKSSIGSISRHTHRDTWLSAETLKIYKKFGFNHIHYVRAGFPPWLNNNLYKLVDEVHALTPLAARSGLIILIDMSTEGNRPGELRNSIKILSQQLSIHTLQVLVINQNIKFENDSILAETSREANILSWAFGDTFAWEAQLHSSAMARIRSIEESAQKELFKKQFICLNNAHRPHRLALYAFLHRTRIIDNTYFSFRVNVPRKGGKETNSKALLAENFSKACNQFSASKRDLELLSSQASELSLSVDDLSDVKSTPQLIWRIPYQAVSDSLFNIVTESNFSDGNYSRFTEKTIKPLLVGRPFIIVGSPHTLSNLRDLGFATFREVVNEDYDSISDPAERLQAVFNEISRLNESSIQNDPNAIALIHNACRFNQNHIASGDLQKRILERHNNTLSESLNRLRRTISD